MYVSLPAPPNDYLYSSSNNPNNMLWQLELHDNHPLGNQKKNLSSARNITLQKYKTSTVINVGFFYEMSDWDLKKTLTGGTLLFTEWVLVTCSGSTTEHLGFWNLTIMMPPMNCYRVFFNSVSGGETISHYVSGPHLTQGSPIFMLKLTLFTSAGKPLTEKGLLLPSSSSKHFFFLFARLWLSYLLHLSRKIDQIGKNHYKTRADCSIL